MKKSLIFGVFILILLTSFVSAFDQYSTLRTPWDKSVCPEAGFGLCTYPSCDSCDGNSSWVTYVCADREIKTCIDYVGIRDRSGGDCYYSDYYWRNVTCDKEGDPGLTPPVFPASQYDFGGMYGHGAGKQINSYKNPATNNWSCPGADAYGPAYTSVQISGSPNVDYDMYYCYRQYTGHGYYDFGGSYGPGLHPYEVPDGKYKNPLNGQYGCPTGYTSYQISGSSLDNPFYICYADPAETTHGKYFFSGFIGSGYLASGVEIVYRHPEGRSYGVYCPLGYDKVRVRVWTGVDLSMYMCTNTTVYYNPEALCDNDFDDDHDGLTDCADSDCNPSDLDLTSFDCLENSEMFVWENLNGDEITEASIGDTVKLKFRTNSLTIDPFATDYKFTIKSASVPSDSIIGENLLGHLEGDDLYYTWHITEANYTAMVNPRQIYFKVGSYNGKDSANYLNLGGMLEEDLCKEVTNNNTCLAVGNNCTWTPRGKISPEAGCCPAEEYFSEHSGCVGATQGKMCTNIFYRADYATDPTLRDDNYRPAVDLDNQKYCAQVTRESSYGFWYPTEAY